MKHLNFAFAALIAGGLITFGGVTVNAQKLAPKVKISTQFQKHKARAARHAVKTAEMLEAQPQTIKTYNYDDNAQDWKLSSIEKRKYDNTNRAISSNATIYTMEGDVSFIKNSTMSYNEDGNIKEQIDEASYDAGETFEKESRALYDYDNICKNTAILREFYSWFDGEWMLDDENEDAYFLEVERDDQNRVTATTQWLNSTKPIALTSKSFEYGEDGKVAKMYWNMLDESYELAPAYEYEIKSWNKTNNQLLNMVPSAYYPFEGDNENNVGEYILYDLDPDGNRLGTNATYNATYDDKGRIKTVELNMSGANRMYKGVYEYDLDENGSFEYRELIAEDQNCDGEISEEEIIALRTHSDVDAYGEITKEETFITDPSTFLETQVEGYIYDTKYDELGNLIELIDAYYTEYVDNGSYVLLKKTEFLDYTGTTTGIQSVNDEKVEVTIKGNIVSIKNADGARYRICDVNGKTYRHGVVTGDISVDDLPNGMYIVKVSGRNANNAVKLIRK